MKQSEVRESLRSGTKEGTWFLNIYLNIGGIGHVMV
ncbi:hypothetical protein LCGC14_0360340 [marine sediment metagenome]|uniref:Uncharacterized protein n=1 Tax=marine sediment metagenome TaxID=412755 RepID=A0A0F9T8E3_9ZZZZ